MYHPSAMTTHNSTYRYINTFNPLPWQAKPWADISPVILFSGSRGGGKALYIDTDIATTNGYVKMRDISVGDIVFDERGKQTTVTEVTDVMLARPCYEISFSTGESVICDANHEWVVGIAGNRSKRVIETAETMFHNQKTGRENSYSVSVCGSVEHDEKELPVSAWLVGFLIGDGYLKNVSFTTADTEIADRVASELEEGHSVEHRPSASNNYTYQILTNRARSKDIEVNSGRVYLHSDGKKYVAMANGDGTEDGYKRDSEYLGMFDTEEEAWNVLIGHTGGMKLTLHGHGLIYNLSKLSLRDKTSATKFIPDIYKYSSVNQRLEVLRGLMDADGHIQPGRGRAEITVISERLANDIFEIACSLGIKAHIAKRDMKFNGEPYDAWRVQFTSDIQVFWLPRKANLVKSKLRKTQYRRYITSIKKVDSVPVKCIEVDSPLHSYLITKSHIPTHNSRLAAERAHAFCLKYPNAVVQVVRKTKSSLKKSVLHNLTTKVIGDDPRVLHHKNDSMFVYDNGSTLIYDGMSDPAARERMKSREPDMVWMEEAKDFTEEDYNEIIALVRGTAAPWRQIVLSTNPDGPLHWINRRLILQDEAKVYYSGAKDNPHLPIEYIESLESLTGVQYQREVLGLWVSGSGIIFDTWKDDQNGKSSNVTAEAVIDPHGGDIIWAIDDGYSGTYDRESGYYTANSHPRAMLLAQRRPDGVLVIADESYAIETLASNHIAEKLKDWPRPYMIVRDRAAASLDGACRENGLRNIIYNTMHVDESIKEMRKWLAEDHNGVRKVLVHPRCKMLRSEMAQYSMDNDGRVIKEHDNGCLVAGTMVATPDGEKKIEDIVSGDMVMTRLGPRPVEVSSMTDSDAEIWRLELSDGRFIEGTGNHPIYVKGAGFVELHSMSPGDTIDCISNYIRRNECRNQKLSLTGESDSGDTQTLKDGQTNRIIPQELLTGNGESRAFTERFTRTILGQFQMAHTSITRMATRLIMTQAILFPSLVTANTRSFMLAKEYTIHQPGQPFRPLPNGTEATRDEHGTENMVRTPGLEENQLPYRATSADQATKHLTGREQIDSVQTPASPHLEEPLPSMTKRGYASGAEQSSQSINTEKQGRAQDRVLRTYATGKRKPVYNLAVADNHEFFANGILTHNCDALRYLIWNESYGRGRKIDVVSWSQIERAHA